MFLVGMAAQDHRTTHTHTFLVPRNDTTYPHEHTPSSVIHYYQRAKFTLANTASSKIPCSILWSEYYRVFSADTKAGLNSVRRLGIDVMVRHKGSTVNPMPPQLFVCTTTKVFCLFLPSVCHSFKHLCQLAGQGAAGVLQQTADNKVYSG